MAIRVFHRDRDFVRLPMIARDARFVVWPGIGAYTANMNYVMMEQGEQNVPHVHASSEDTLFILSGKGSIEDFTHGIRSEFEGGAGHSRADRNPSRGEGGPRLPYRKCRRAFAS